MNWLRFIGAVIFAPLIGSMIGFIPFLGNPALVLIYGYATLFILSIPLLLLAKKNKIQNFLYFGAIGALANMSACAAILTFTSLTTHAAHGRPFTIFVFFELPFIFPVLISGLFCGFAAWAFFYWPIKKAAVEPPFS